MSGRRESALSKKKVADATGKSQAICILGLPFPARRSPQGGENRRTPADGVSPASRPTV